MSKLQLQLLFVRGLFHVWIAVQSHSVLLGGMVLAEVLRKTSMALFLEG